jgi:hypothetical protein
MNTLRKGREGFKFVKTIDKFFGTLKNNIFSNLTYEISKASMTYESFLESVDGNLKVWRWTFSGKCRRSFIEIG